MTISPTQLAEIDQIIKYRTAAGVGRGGMDERTARTLFAIFAPDAQPGLLTALKDDAVTVLLRLLYAAESGECPECPECPATTGMVWGADATTLSRLAFSDMENILGTGVTTLAFPSLETITAEGDFEISGSELTSLTFPVLSTIEGGPVVNLHDLSNVTTLAFPELVTIDGNLTISNNDLLTSIDLPQLISVTDALDFSANQSLATLSFPALAFWPTGGFTGPSLLTTLNLPVLTDDASGGLFTSINNTMPGMVTVNLNSLVSISADIDLGACAALTTFNAPLMLPANASNLTFLDCALNAASVNLILARCVAAGVTTCDIDLTGGTNAAPTGQGIIDKAALITAGNTVDTN